MAQRPRPHRPRLFFRQVIAELRKVIWPTRDQLITYFLVVLVFVLFMIAFVSVFDFVVQQGRVRGLRLTSTGIEHE